MNLENMKLVSDTTLKIPDALDQLIAANVRIGHSEPVFSDIVEPDLFKIRGETTVTEKDYESKSMAFFFM